MKVEVDSPRVWKPSFERLLASGDLTASIRYLASRIADYEQSFINPFGHYFDEDIDRSLIQIAESLPGTAHCDERGPIVHVASSLYDWGGHTLQIIDYVKSLPESKHRLVITDIPSLITGEPPLAQLAPVRVSQLKDLGVEIKFLDGSVEDRISSLTAELDQSRFALIHHHPWDAAAIIGAAKFTGRKIINFHSDNSLTLGLTLGWDVACYREATKLFFREKLARAKFFVVPLTSNLEDQPVRQNRSNGGKIVTVGASSSPKKIYPFGNSNYFDLIGQLTRDFDIIHYHIGPLTNEIRALKYGHQLKFPTLRERMRLRNLVPQLQNSEMSFADLFIDSTPISGGKTVIDALALGIPVVTFPPQHNDLISNFDYAARSGMAFNSYDDFSRWFERFCNDLSFQETVSSSARDYYVKNHSNEVFRKCVRRLVENETPETLMMPTPKEDKTLSHAHASSILIIETLSRGHDSIKTDGKIFVFAQKFYKRYLRGMPGAKRLAHYIKNMLSRF